MGNNWPSKTLREVGVTLIDCVHKTPPATDIGFPYIAIPQMKEGRIDFDANPRIISGEDLETWTVKANPKEFDVLLSRRCNPGETAYVPPNKKFALGQNLVLLRSTGNEIYPPFLRWLVRSNEWWFEVERFRNPGAVFDSLKCADIPEFKVPIPPIEHQQKIAGVLGALDSKIELNRKINQTLESMAQALFKSWFVDFDPVIDNALAAGNEIPEPFTRRAAARKSMNEKANTGQSSHPILPEDVRQLFPSSFQFTEELGWIPEGWEVDSFEALARLDTTSVKPHQHPEQLWEHYSIPAFDVDESASKDLGVEIKSNKYRVSKNALLCSKLNPATPRVWWVDADNEEMAICSTEFMQFIPHNFNLRAFIFGLIKSSPFQEGILQRVTGSTGSRQRAQPPEVARMKVVVPDERLMKEYSAFASPLLSKKAKNISINNTLGTLRNTLLPKLLSGELRIPDAEKLAAEAVV